VDPDVDHVARMARNRDPPLKGGPADGEVLHPALDELDHLVPPALGLDELRMPLDVLEEPGHVLGQPEEEALLLDPLDGPAAVGAVAVHQPALGPEGLAGHAVPALILGTVDVPLGLQPLEDLLDYPHVPRLGGADKVIILGVEPLPE